MSKSSKPSKSSIAWADTPFPLIPITFSSADVRKHHEAAWVAREMACAHNGMIRALNSIYQQCIHVSEPEDIKDLLSYTRFWFEWLHEHHEGEETFLFPRFEQITGVKGLMETNVDQHRDFARRLEDLKRLIDGTNMTDYDGMKLRAVIDGFSGTLMQHLREEISTLQALEIYDGPALKKATIEFDLEMRKGDKSILFPMVMGSSDVDFENADGWPEAPGFVRYAIHYWFERKHQGAWRFSPSTTWGKRRPLMFLGDAE